MASDLTPAFMAAGAAIEIGGKGGGPSRFPRRGASLPAGGLLTRLFTPRSGRLSTHARQPLRNAGDYPVAVVSVSLERIARAWADNVIGRT